ncbi:MAG: PAS domain S-box protein, partial [Methylobacter sp.]|nr:PAS domain S-box protein [Methylobacter sp.]
EFRVLVENSPDLIFRYDKKCRRIYTNPAVARLIGKRAGALLNKSPSEAKILSAGEADKLMQMIRQVLTTGQPAESEVECLGADGQLHYFHNRYAPEFSAHGEVVGVISIARDVTERKQAERRLWLMDFALNQVREAVYIIDKANHNFISVNDEACRALGYSREELLRMNVLDIDPDGDLAEMQQLQCDIDAADLTVFERRHKTKDGCIFPVEINAQVFEYEGRPTSIALVRDITERKRIEDEIRALNADLEQRVLERTEALRQQTRYLRTMIDTLPMLAWLKDKESRFLVVNQALASACAHNVDDLVGKSDLDFWPREHAEAYRADDAEVMATGQRKTVEEP